MTKTTILLLGGGQSTEHQVSLLSATNVLTALSREKYDILTVGIDRDGTWRWFPDGQLAVHTDDAEAVCLAPGGCPAFPLRLNGRPVLALADASHEPMPFDLLFPVLHGCNGEDGTIQGLAQLLGCPCVGCGMTSSAIAMDKAFTKQVLEHEGIVTAKWLQIRAGEEIPSAQEVIAKLGLPLFVKSANGGSSVGVVKVHSAEEFAPAVEEAFRYDRKVLVEEAVTGREIECAVMGNEQPFCPTPGEIIPKCEYYSYDAKYILDDGAVVVAPTTLPVEQEATVRDLAVRVYHILGCRGMSRIDFFLRPDGQFILNEINTIPGFTRISMFPKLMLASGIPYPELVDRLVQLSLHR